MKYRKIVLPLTVLLITGAIAFVISHYLLYPDSQKSAESLENFTLLAEELELNGDQRKKVEKLHDEMRRKLAECCRRHCDARMKLGTALGRGKTDDEKIESSMDKMTDAYRESELITLKYIRRVRKLLNSEQKKRFEQILEKEICSPCPVCGSQR